MRLSTPRRLLFTALAALVCLSSPAPAQAVVPTAKATLRRASAITVVPAPTVATWVERPIQGPPSLALRVVFDGAGRLRLDRQSLADGHTDTCLWDAAVARDGAGELAPGTEVLPLSEAPAWLLWLAGRPIADIARDAGVDLSVSSLDHRGADILVVVGATPHQLDRSQLHFDRESGRLVGALDLARHGGSAARATRHVELYAGRHADPAGELRAAAGDDLRHEPGSPVRGDDSSAAGPAPGAAADSPAGTSATDAPGETAWPARLVLIEDGRRIELVNTWLRVGDHVDPSLLEAPEPAEP